MHISEIFYSIQGEGLSIGKPAIFLRLSGCHLRCTWCDSKFAWDLKSGKEINTKEIIKEIKKYPAKHLVITGGEPLIQQSALKELFTQIKGYYIEMETSGSIKSELHKYIDQYNCSPKMKNSGNKTFKLEKFPKEKTNYKFVVSDEKDIREIKSLKIPKKQIILMPEGTKKRELTERSKWLVEICKKENFRFSPRLHINIWGNKRKH